jgi:NAD(P)-dependent dehydrogenase (short-subunit alcohol dehydrogenase family)
MLKTTIITGATNGIGKIIANGLLNKNHKIINLSKSGIIPELFQNKNFESYKCDISDVKNTHEIVSRITEKYKIDNVILNAGITNDNFFHKMKFNEWNDVINTNLLSIYGVLNPVINQMRKNEKGNVLFISSINAHRPVIGQTNYSASKNGIIAFNRCLAIENSNKNIKCNVISPGYIESDMSAVIKEDIKQQIINSIPLKRFGKPEEVLEIVELLLSENNYFQGANIDLNGGLFIR